MGKIRTGRNGKGRVKRDGAKLPSLTWLSYQFPSGAKGENCKSIKYVSAYLEIEEEKAKEGRRSADRLSQRRRRRGRDRPEKKRKRRSVLEGDT